MSSNDALFFNEGAGFAFVRTLGQGNNGRADLVRSLSDNRLYVRKQLTTAYPVDRASYHRPQREINMATKIRGFEGVARLQAWAIYADRARHQIRGDVATFEVTYWDSYNAGTFNSVLQEAASRNVPISEYWVCSWLVQSVGILVKLHGAGFAHRDAHGGNWFLHRTDNHSTPQVILGDFDDMTKRFSTRNTKETQKMFQSDYEKLAHALSQMLALSDRPHGGPLSALLTVMSKYSHQSFRLGWSVVERMRILRNEARRVQRRLPPPTVDQILMAHTAQSDPLSTRASSQRLRAWSMRVQRYMPISPDAGFELVAARGWDRPFI